MGSNIEMMTGYPKSRAERKARHASLLSVCAWCGMVRNEDGSRRAVTEEEKFSPGLLTHGICLDCLYKICPETYANLFD